MTMVLLISRFVIIKLIQILKFINNLFFLKQDRHIINKDVLIDKEQNWKLLASSQKNGYTIFKFTRPLILCNSEDRVIEVKEKIYKSFHFIYA